ncbi:hypothetical protein G6O69_38375 [Pseudenhygromyxa sp. WMMC2535]|uniref:hypothetical protein n=1 Tax=Pseudenhygromyxa sp. WMMC2535 TaxID=2712867 RepID=UPI0015545181|nr:hypothetical protein [Pseudenhygromyxa sp. WMMC2535]NVB36225.1 hypothetical protein [Pseudenhygromyxa sp. WMMC2535]NVB43732.1 hypothetical protein [Pseudenhygromyxa sp. WMMC2535]
MPSISSQFYATEEELAEMVSSWLNSYDINGAAVFFFPFSVINISSQTIEAGGLSAWPDEFVFSEYEISCSAKKQSEFMDANTDILILNLGSLGPRGLSESHLSTLESTPTWKKIASDLKRRTKAGMKGKHEQNGAEGVDRNCRYTPGAKRLYESGISLRQFPQSAIVMSPLPVNK